MAAGSTNKLLHFFGKSFDTYVLQKCCSTLNYKNIKKQRSDIKTFLDSIARKVSHAPDEDVLDLLNEIKDYKSLDVLKKWGLKVVNTHEEEVQHTSYYQAGQVISGLVGAGLSLFSSYAMAKATEIATIHIMEQWFGAPKAISERTGEILGWVGGVTMAMYRGNGTRSTFQSIHESIDSNVAQRSRLDVKIVAGEALKCILSVFATAPRTKIVLDSIPSGALQKAVLGTNMIATWANDYFGWGKIPATAKTLFTKTKPRDIVLNVLAAISQDVDNMNQESLTSFHTRIFDSI